jgi:hypothetical protein
VRKQELVEQLNTLLGMENPISVWQCLQIRKYELQEMVDKVHDLYRGDRQCSEIREQCPIYKSGHNTASSDRKPRRYEV